jgi:hypothetical protein
MKRFTSARAAGRGAEDRGNHPFSRAWRPDLRVLFGSARAAGRGAQDRKNHPFRRAWRPDLRVFIIGSLALGAFAVALPGAGYKLEEREAFHRTFANASAMDVDEINGSIAVIGDGGNTIRVDGEKVMRADDAEEMARAKREVVLDINEKSGIAQLYVNGPFRNDGHTSEDHGFHAHSDRHYETTYNFTIRVPRATALRLHSVNGKIDTEETAGKFDVHTVNGALTMTNIAGSGSAETLNGNTTITFRENPKADSLFKTFNGHVEVGFQPGLSANIRVKTFNGSAFTDFESTALPSTVAPAERRDGRFVFRGDKSSSLRVGQGGPELKFETFNGSIKIRKLTK